MDNLKPCPFCGSTNLRDCYVTIKCIDCGAEGPKMNGGRNDDHADYVDHERAINTWNTRPGEDAAVAAERERIIQYITTHQQKCYVAHGRTMTGVHVLPLIDAIRDRGGE